MFRHAATALCLLLVLCTAALAQGSAQDLAQSPAGFTEAEGMGIPATPPDETTEANATAGDTPPAAQAPELPPLALAAPDRVDLGAPFLVRLTSVKPLGEVAVHWEGKSVTPSISVWNDKGVALAMLGTDVLNAEPGDRELVVTADVDGERKTFRRTVRVAAKAYPEQRLEVDQAYVTPPESEYERIAADRKAVHAALATASPKRWWTLPFARPVDGEPSSAYGLRRILNGTPKSPHRGLDLKAPMGTPVHAAAAGEVILAADHYYAGRSVYLDHGGGVVSMYFHLSQVGVEDGQFVNRGDLVGLSGSSGRVTGPHLHFGVAVQGRLVDPEPLIHDTVDQLLAE